MTQEHDTTTKEQSSHIFHPRFAAFYERYACLGSERRLTDPLRQETAGKAYGTVLEVGVGTGLNFSWYRPEQVEQVEAIEPDSAMLTYAQQRARRAPVPIRLTQASIENLPFADASFDSVVVSLVFCSVEHPARGIQEIKRVLKPQGTLFLFEHVRSQNTWLARLQDALVPVTTRLFGNCHWNRDTAQIVQEAGFDIMRSRDVKGGLAPHLVLQALRQ